MKNVTFFITFISSSSFWLRNDGESSFKNESELTVRSKIVENKTTKDDVRKTFGSPDESSFTDNGKEIWKYEFANIKADAVNYIPIVNLFGSSSSGTKNN